MRNVRELFKKPDQGLTGIHINMTSLNAVRLHCDTSTEATRPKISDYRLTSIDNKTDLDQFLKGLCAEMNLKHSSCTTLLAEKDYSLLQTDAPNIPDDELATALRWQVKDLLEQPIDQTTFDSFPAPQAADISAKPSLYVIAAKNTAIQQQVDLFTRAGINLDVIDIQEMALRNIASMIHEDDQVTTIIWFRQNDGLLLIVKDNNIYLNRSMSIGLDELRSSVDLDATIEKLALEIQRSVDYYDSKYKSTPIRKLILSPGATNTTTDLEQKLSALLNLKVNSLDLGKYIDHPDNMPDSWQQSLFIPIGAALRSGHIAA